MISAMTSTKKEIITFQVASNWTVNVTSLSNYQNLTVSNFLIGINTSYSLTNKSTSKENSNSGNQTEGLSNNENYIYGYLSSTGRNSSTVTLTPTISYNASAGIITVTPVKLILGGTSARANCSSNRGGDIGISASAPEAQVTLDPSYFTVFYLAPGQNIQTMT